MHERDGVAVGRLDRDREPLAATVPANVTVPAAGATHRGRRAAPPMSIPRCWPAERSGFVASKANGRRTGPGTGHVQAPAAARASPGAKSTASDRDVGSQSRSSVASSANREPRRYQAVATVVKSDYRRAAVERVPRRTGQPRDELGRLPPRHSRRRRARRPPRAPLPRHAPPRRGAAPSTSVISPFGGSAKRAASSAAVPRTTSSKRFVSSRQTATAPLRDHARRATASDARQPLRRLERDHRPRPARELLATAPPAPARRAAGSRRTGSARRRGRSRRAPSRPPTAPGSTVTGTPASSAAATSRAPGSLIARQAGVADERDPLAGLRAAAAARPSAPPRCARGRRAAARGSRGAPAGRACAACPRRGRRPPRRARASTRSVTSSRFPIGVAQTASGTQRERLERDHPGADHARLDAELGLDDPHVVARRLERLDARRPRAPAPAAARPRLAEAAADDDQLRLEDVDEGSRSRRRASGRSRPAPRPLAARPRGRGGRARARRAAGP